VLENVYGVSPQLFSVLFAVNAIGLAAGAQLNGRLVRRVASSRLLLLGLAGMAAGGLSLLGLVVSHAAGLAAFLPPLFVVISCLGFVIPNSIALALSGHPSVAGSASALLGALQFMIGAAVAPLVGVAGSHSALPMAILMAALATAGFATLPLLAGMGHPSADWQPGSG
jgi:DHA1 family bicyclomycin/chloramphenicol resistance-like MFS transporter